MLASELVDYGIQTEDSDIRAHVSVVAGKVYVFPTKLAVALVKSGKYPERKAWQPGIPYPTAKGYIIPWRDIPNIVPVAASKFIREQNFGSEDSTTLKGEKASNVVEGLVRLGWFPLAVLPIWDPDLMADEVHRVAAKGCHAVTFSENPEKLGLPSFHRDSTVCSIPVSSEIAFWVVPVVRCCTYAHHLFSTAHTVMRARNILSCRNPVVLTQEHW